MLNPEGFETVLRAVLAPEDEFLLTEELYTNNKDMITEWLDAQLLLLVGILVF